MTKGRKTMLKKGKSKKNNQQEPGLDQALSIDVVMPDDMSEEADPPNRAVLAAIAALRNGVAQIKEDICATIDARIQTVYITALEKTTALHENTIREIEKSASHHSDVTTLQRQVTRLNSDVEKLTEKCEDLEGSSRRHNIWIIGIPEGTEGPRPRDFIAGLLQDVLSLDEKPLIDRAHRTLRKRLEPHEPPRPFI